MSDHKILNCRPRVRDQGKGASRRLRRAGKVPAILYGAGKDPVRAISLDHNAVLLSLENEAFYSHILTVKLDGRTRRPFCAICSAIPTSRCSAHGSAAGQRE
jgi:large subunit ribosomal protein L25